MKFFGLLTLIFAFLWFKLGSSPSPIEEDESYAEERSIKNSSSEEFEELGDAMKEVLIKKRAAKHRTIANEQYPHEPQHNWTVAAQARGRQDPKKIIAEVLEIAQGDSGILLEEVDIQLQSLGGDFNTKAQLMNLLRDSAIDPPEVVQELCLRELTSPLHRPGRNDLVYPFYISTTFDVLLSNSDNPEEVATHLKTILASQGHPMIQQKLQEQYLARFGVDFNTQLNN